MLKIVVFTFLCRFRHKNKLYRISLFWRNQDFFQKKFYSINYWCHFCVIKFTITDGAIKNGLHFLGLFKVRVEFPPIYLIHQMRTIFVLWVWNKVDPFRDERTIDFSFNCESIKTIRFFSQSSAIFLISFFHPFYTSNHRMVFCLASHSSATGSSQSSTA